ncbi:hypothetical protein D3C81_1943690 [compost metagenome]
MVCGTYRAGVEVRVAVVTSFTRGSSGSVSAVTETSGKVVVPAALARPALNSKERPRVRGERRQAANM